MVSLSDVAKEAGVSVSVVSRVLNDDPELRARPETRQRVRDAAERLDYVRNNAARGLRLGLTGSVGLAVPDVTNPFFSELLRGVESAVDRFGQTVLLAQTTSLTSNDDSLRRLVREGRVDGFVLQITDVGSEAELVERIGTKLPIVIINREWPSVGSVVADDAGAARMATEHLIQLGHTEIGLVGGLKQSYAAGERQRGFVETLAEHGLAKPARWISHTGFGPEEGEAGVQKIWASGKPPTALVVANVHGAIGVLRGLRRLGVRVPEDVSVVAVHDSWVAPLAMPALTTVELPLFEMGAAAIEQLHRRLVGGAPEHQMITDPAPILHLRESTAPIGSR